MEVGGGEEVEMLLGADQEECLGLGLVGGMLEVKSVLNVVLEAKNLNGLQYDALRLDCGVSWIFVCYGQ